MHFDVLVNNAAITCGNDHERIMSVNCNGTHFVTETVLKGMVQRNAGTIVFITSIHTRMAFLGDTAYDASKTWAVGYMRGIALDYAKYGIRSNAVAPGATLQAGTNRDLPLEEFYRVNNKIPLGWTLPRHIASAVAYLASDDSESITGQELRVDGGLSVMNPLQSLV